MPIDRTMLVAIVAREADITEMQAEAAINAVLRNLSQIFELNPMHRSADGTTWHETPVSL